MKLNRLVLETAANGQQLELTFDRGRGVPGAAPPRLSGERAAWWFDRIHRRLQEAWRPPPPARPEQQRLVLGEGTGAWCDRL